LPRPDPAWLDRQYNNRARVPDHAAIFERWARASALAREGSRCHLDLPYGSGPNETLDVFPAADANAPVLVFSTAAGGARWTSASTPSSPRCARRSAGAPASAGVASAGSGTNADADAECMIARRGRMAHRPTQSAALAVYIGAVPPPALACGVPPV